MTNETANQAYFEWLINQTESPDEYRSLLELFHKAEFVWVVANDDNRIADAEDLRIEYLASVGNHNLMLIPYISVLEVLIALSRRCSFQNDQPPEEWMTFFIFNLGLARYRGVIGRRRQSQVEDVIDNFIWRRYTHHGEGGLFPLKRPREDQTKVELWYQMHAYLIEHS